MRARVLVRTQFATCVGPQICLSVALVATEIHLWLNLSNIKGKHNNLFMDGPISPSGLFGDAVNSVVERFQKSAKQAAAFQKLLPAVFISLGLLSGSSPKHLKPAPSTVPHKSRAWLIVLPHIKTGDMVNTINRSLQRVKRI